MNLDINSDAVVAHTAKLERLHKSALPVAVRSSLNRAAFDVKTNTMPKTAKVFTQRSPTFFKANSKVQKAEGFRIADMRATVGFIKGNASKEIGGATEDLKQQENAGLIDHRAFIPIAGARAGKSYNRRVRNNYRLSLIRRQMFNAKSKRLHGAKNNKEAFTLSAIYAGKGGFVIGTDKKNGARKVMVINSVKRVGKDMKVNSTAIYNVKGDRKVKVKNTNFMRKASVQSATKIEQYYIEEANKQIARLK